VSPDADPPPRFFLDRSLGAVVVPTLLRTAGFEVETMRERYGERRAQTVADTDWLADVGAAGLVVLMKDKRIRTRPAEQRAVVRYGIRCFCLARGNLTGEQMAASFVSMRSRILTACGEPGPFLWSVSSSGLRRLL
jgi:hypothetical protein